MSTIAKKNLDTRYIYIMISRTSTVPSKIIRAYTKETYAHTSLALDLNLENMYSFARKRIHNPIDCGFIYEDIETGIFGRDKDTICRVYALSVTAKQYARIVEEIDIFKKNQPKYSYNYKGIVGIMFNKPVVRDYKYFCSQFVAHVLEKSGIKLFEKNTALASPTDFKLALEDRMIYDGLLTEYREYIKGYSVDDVEDIILGSQIDDDIVIEAV